LSCSFRQRLKLAFAKDLKEKLGLSQDEIDWTKYILKQASESDLEKILENSIEKYSGEKNEM